MPKKDSSKNCQDDNKAGSQLKNDAIRHERAFSEEPHSSSPAIPSSSTGGTENSPNKRKPHGFLRNLFGGKNSVAEKCDGTPNSAGLSVASSYESVNSVTSTNSFSFVSPKKYRGAKGKIALKGKRIPLQEPPTATPSNSGAGGKKLGTLGKLGVKMGLKKKYNLQSCESLDNINSTTTAVASSSSWMTPKKSLLPPKSPPPPNSKSQPKISANSKDTKNDSQPTPNPSDNYLEKIAQSDVAPSTSKEISSQGVSKENPNSEVAAKFKGETWGTYGSRGRKRRAPLPPTCASSASIALPDNQGVQLKAVNPLPNADENCPPKLPENSKAPYQSTSNPEKKNTTGEETHLASEKSPTRVQGPSLLLKRCNSVSKHCKIVRTGGQDPEPGLEGPWPTGALKRRPKTGGPARPNSCSCSSSIFSTHSRYKHKEYCSCSLGPPRTHVRGKKKAPPPPNPFGDPDETQADPMETQPNSKAETPTKLPLPCLGGNDKISPMETSKSSPLDVASNSYVGAGKVPNCPEKREDSNLAVSSKEVALDRSKDGAATNVQENAAANSKQHSSQAAPTDVSAVHEETPKKIDLQSGKSSSGFLLRTDSKNGCQATQNGNLSPTRRRFFQKSDNYRNRWSSSNGTKTIWSYNSTSTSTSVSENGQNSGNSKNSGLQSVPESGKINFVENSESSEISQATSTRTQSPTTPEENVNSPRGTSQIPPSSISNSLEEEEIAQNLLNDRQERLLETSEPGEISPTSPSKSRSGKFFNFSRSKVKKPVEKENSLKNLIKSSKTLRNQVNDVDSQVKHQLGSENNLTPGGSGITPPQNTLLVKSLENKVKTQEDEYVDLDGGQKVKPSTSLPWYKRAMYSSNSPRGKSVYGQISNRPALKLLPKFSDLDDEAKKIVEEKKRRSAGISPLNSENNDEDIGDERRVKSVEEQAGEIYPLGNNTEPYGRSVGSPVDVATQPKQNATGLSNSGATALEPVSNANTEEGQSRKTERNLPNREFAELADHCNPASSTNSQYNVPSTSSSATQNKRESHDSTTNIGGNKEQQGQSLNRNVAIVQPQTMQPVVKPSPTSGQVEDKPQPMNEPSAATPSREEEWSCSRCTLKNPGWRALCELCYQRKTPAQQPNATTAMLHRLSQSQKGGPSTKTSPQKSLNDPQNSQNTSENENLLQHQVKKDLETIKLNVDQVQGLAIEEPDIQKLREIRLAFFAKEKEAGENSELPPPNSNDLSLPLTTIQKTSAEEEREKQTISLVVDDAAAANSKFPQNDEKSNDEFGRKLQKSQRRENVGGTSKFITKVDDPEDELLEEIMVSQNMAGEVNDPLVENLRSRALSPSWGYRPSSALGSRSPGGLPAIEEAHSSLYSQPYQGDEDASKFMVQQNLYENFIPAPQCTFIQRSAVDSWSSSGRLLWNSEPEKSPTSDLFGASDEDREMSYERYKRQGAIPKGFPHRNPQGSSPLPSNSTAGSTGSEVDSGAVSGLLRRLEWAISAGEHRLAASLAHQLALLKAPCVLAKPNPIRIRVYVEDRFMQQGPFVIQVVCTMKLGELKEKIESDWGIPKSFQKWILGRNMAEEDELTLAEYDISENSMAFLYLVTPHIQSNNPEILNPPSQISPAKSNREMSNTHPLNKLNSEQTPAQYSNLPQKNEFSQITPENKSPDSLSKISNLPGKLAGGKPLNNNNKMTEEPQPPPLPAKNKTVVSNSKSQNINSTKADKQPEPMGKPKTHEKVEPTTKLKDEDKSETSSKPKPQDKPEPTIKPKTNESAEKVEPLGKPKNDILSLKPTNPPELMINKKELNPISNRSNSPAMISKKLPKTIDNNVKIEKPQTSNISDSNFTNKEEISLYKKPSSPIIQPKSPDRVLLERTHSQSNFPPKKKLEKIPTVQNLSEIEKKSAITRKAENKISEIPEISKKSKESENEETSIKVNNTVVPVPKPRSNRKNSESSEPPILKSPKISKKKSETVIPLTKEISKSPPILTHPPVNVIEADPKPGSSKSAAAISHVTENKNCDKNKKGGIDKSTRSNLGGSTVEAPKSSSPLEESFSKLSLKESSKDVKPSEVKSGGGLAPKLPPKALSRSPTPRKLERRNSDSSIINVFQSLTLLEGAAGFSPPVNEPTTTTTNINSGSSTSAQSQDKKEDNIQTYLSMLEMERQDLIICHQTFECPVCLTDVQSGQGVTLRDCLHNFCRECLVGAVEFAEESEVKCPFRDREYSCNSAIQQREIKALVPQPVFDRYLTRSVQLAERRMKNSFHCRSDNCTGWCVFEDDVNVFNCPVCREVNCITCAAIHSGMNCQQYQEKLKNDAENDPNAKTSRIMLQKMIERGEALECPACHVVLLKKWGCDWVRCSFCKTEICWITKGFRWGPGGKGDTSGGCKCGVNGVKCHPKCVYCH